MAYLQALIQYRIMLIWGSFKASEGVGVMQTWCCGHADEVGQAIEGFHEVGDQCRCHASGFLRLIK